MERTFKKIQDQVSKLDTLKLLKGLGVNNKKIGKRRLDEFIKSKDIDAWFKNNSFDFKYSSIEFLKKLCAVCSIDENLLELEIIDYQERKDRLEKQFESYIFIDTDFKRENESITMLSLSEPKRHILIDKNSIAYKSFFEQFEEVKKMVLAHFKKTNGDIGIWKQVKRYTWYYAQNKSVSFLPDGSVCGFNLNENYDKATALSVK